MVGPVLSRRVEIVNRKGLHARAASKLARLAGEFEAEVTVGKDDLAVPATSIMGLMLLTGTQGSSVMLRAHGPAAREAIRALSALIANGFDEDD